MFIGMNPDFGFTAQSNSMFNAVNIEFGFNSQPNSAFNFVNIEIGWGGSCGGSCGGGLAAVAVPPSTDSRSPDRKVCHERGYARAVITPTLLLALAACSHESQFTFANASSRSITVAYTPTGAPRNDCAPKLGVAAKPGLLGGGGQVTAATPAEHQAATDGAGLRRITVTVQPGAALLLCSAVNEGFGSLPPVHSVGVSTAEGVELLSVSQGGLSAVFQPEGMFVWIWRYAG